MCTSGYALTQTQQAVKLAGRVKIRVNIRSGQPHLCSLALALFPGHDALVGQAESQEQQPDGDDGEPEHSCCRAALSAVGSVALAFLACGRRKGVSTETPPLLSATARNVCRVRALQSAGCLS